MTYDYINLKCCRSAKMALGSLDTAQLLKKTENPNPISPNELLLHKFAVKSIINIKWVSSDLIFNLASSHLTMFSISVSEAFSS